MKREELDKLRMKYLEGQTSIEEERRLKSLEEDEFFSALNEPEEKMDWSFESFLEQVEEESPKKKIVPISRRIIMITSIAAAVLMGFFVIRQMVENRVSNSDLLSKEVGHEVAPVIAHQEVGAQALDVERPKEEPQAVVVENEVSKYVPKKDARKTVQMASMSGHTVNKEEPVKVTHALEDELYVEINGVRIYDEEKALEVTETALHLATSNLKKGMEGVENIKYLKIEI